VRADGQPGGAAVVRIARISLGSLENAVHIQLVGVGVDVPSDGHVGPHSRLQAVVADGSDVV